MHISAFIEYIFPYGAIALVHLGAFAYLAIHIRRAGETWKIVVRWTHHGIVELYIAVSYGLVLFQYNPH